MPEPQIIVVARPARAVGFSLRPDIRRDPRRLKPAARRWRTMALVSSALAIISAGAIWLLVHPAYRVSARLHVAPNGIPAIPTYVGAGNGAVGHYREYLATEVVNLTSEALLRATSKAPEVRSLSWLAGVSDPAAHIGDRLAVAPVEGTQLIDVAMTGDRPAELAVIVNAVVQAHLDLRDQRRRTREREIVSTLTEERRALQSALAANTVERGRVGAALGALSGESAATIDGQAAALRGELTQLQQKRALAWSRAEGFSPRGSAVGENLALDGRLTYPDVSRRTSGPAPTRARVLAHATRHPARDELKEFLAQDRNLQNLETELEQIETELLKDERKGRLPRHPDVRANLERTAVLRERISRRENELRGPYLTAMTQKLEAELGDIEVSIAVITKELDELSRQRTLIADQTRRLGEIRDERLRLVQDLSQIRQKIREVAVQRNQGSYVTIYSSAEPPAVPNVDHRPLYTVIAVGLSLIIGMVVALIRHRPMAGSCDSSVLVRRPGISARGAGPTAGAHVSRSTSGSGGQVVPQAVDQRLLDVDPGVNDPSPPSPPPVSTR